jgi:hypothetical protein
MPERRSGSQDTCTWGATTYSEERVGRHHDIFGLRLFETGVVFVVGHGPFVAGAWTPLSEGAHIVSMFLRRPGAHSRSIVTALVVFAVALALAVPAFGATAKSVHIRIEGQHGTIFNGARDVPATAMTDNMGAPYNVGVSAMAAIGVAGRLGGFPYVIRDTAYGESVDSINGENYLPDPPYYGWMYRVNGVSLPIASDTAVLKSGDSVLWFFGAWDAKPAVARPVTRLVKLGATLTVKARQVDDAARETTLAGAVVHVGSRTATASADGAVSLPMTAVGDYGVRVEKDGFIRSEVVMVHVRKATAVKSLKVSANDVEVGARPIVSGVLMSGTSKLASRSVRLWHRAKGSSKWVAGPIKVTGSAGTVRFTVKPLRSTYYRFTYAGSSTYAPVTSASKLVTIR